MYFIDTVCGARTLLYKSGKWETSVTENKMFNLVLVPSSTTTQAINLSKLPRDWWSINLTIEQEREQEKRDAVDLIVTVP